MAEALRSTLGYGLNLPSNLKPDDTELLFFYSRPREADSHDPIYRSIVKLSPNSDSDDSEDYIIVKKRFIRKPPEEIRRINEATMIDHITATKAKFEIEFSMESLMGKYGHCLDKQTVFSPKARYRMEYCAIALTYFNKTNKKNYKLVDCLPQTALWVGRGYAYHINFIARQNSPADPSKKLFFAELQTPVGVENLVVKSCHLIDEACKTTAGCYLCTHYNGRRIVHPTSGFSFGLLPNAQTNNWELVDRV